MYYGMIFDNVKERLQEWNYLITITIVIIAYKVKFEYVKYLKLKIKKNNTITINDLTTVASAREVSHMNPYLDFSSDESLLQLKTNYQTYIILKLLENHIKKSDIKNLNILDFGCGHGNISLALAYDVNNVIGYDVSSKMIEYSESIKKRLYDLDSSLKIKDNVKFTTKLNHKKIDIILAINSIHFIHLNEIEDTIKMFLSKITAQGLIIIKEPTRYSKFAALKDKHKDKKFKEIEETEKKLDEVLLLLKLKRNIRYKKFSKNLNTNIYLIKFAE